MIFSKILIKKPAIFFGIIIFAMGILGLPFSRWGMKTDDFGNLYHARIGSIKEIPRFFCEGNMERFNHSSNAVDDSSSGFLSGLYRPMSFIYYWLQIILFDTNAFGYFLITILVHALNAGLLFLLLSRIISLVPAALGGLFFCFHPSLWNWLGWISAQTYFIELFVMLCMLLLLLHIAQKNKFSWPSYAFACLLYASNLFLKEQMIFFPGWLVLAGALFFYYVLQLSWLQSIKKGVLLSLGFWAVVVGYCLARLSQFPWNGKTGSLTFEPTLAGFAARMKERVMDFISYAVDLLGLSFIPGGNRMVKGAVLLTVLSIMLLVLMRSKKKILLLFCLATVPLMSWPALLMHYQPRYIYLALPWIVAFFAIALDQECRSFCVRSMFLAPGKMLFFALALFNAACLYGWMRQREEVFYCVKKSFEDLIENKLAAIPDWHDRPLCFMALPNHWFAMGTAQAMWFLDKNYHQPVYYCGPMVTIGHDDNYLTHPQSDEANIIVEKIDQMHCRIATSNPLSLGLGRENGREITCRFGDAVINENAIIVTWDFKRKNFMIVES